MIAGVLAGFAQGGTQISVDMEIFGIFYSQMCHIRKKMGFELQFMLTCLNTHMDKHTLKPQLEFSPSYRNMWDSFLYLPSFVILGAYNSYSCFFLRKKREIRLGLRGRTGIS